MRILACDEAALDEAARILKSGGVVVIPTDTVYGLAAHPEFPDAVERLYTIKGREEKKPIALLASSAEAVAKFGCLLDGDAAKLAAKHWPGALTLVLPVPRSSSEGVRVPDHDWTRRLIEKCGGVLRVTSANLSGQKAATDVPQALRDVGLDADLVIDGGVSPGGIASTVVKVTEDGRLGVLRAGPKNVLRTALSLRRREMSVEEKSVSDAKICEALTHRVSVRSAVENLSPIAVYLATKDEIDLSVFIEKMMETGVPICVPRWNGESYRLAIFTGLGKCRVGPMGILEPEEDIPVGEADVDVWICPGLAFTSDGLRMGYGGGWYDRFLENASPNAMKIGVARDFQVLSSIPTDPHDIRLDAVVVG